MSTDLIRDSAERLFGRKENHRDPAKLWREAEAAGFGLALLSEAEGGVGLSTEEALEPVIIAGLHAAPVPLAETMLANWLLARSGEAPAEGAALVARQSVAPLSWGGAVSEVLVVDDGGALTRLRAEDCSWQPVSSLSGDPVARLTAHAGPAARVSTGVSSDHLEAMAALLRAAQIAGGLEGVVALSLGYAAERVQFGRSLGKFQAIQHYLARMANEAAAARAGVAMAAAAADRGNTEHLIALCAAAKIRAGEAVAPVTELAHQIHGAIGFSQEYPLHPLTRRLWLWRELDGDEALWSERLGALLMSGRKKGLWSQITEFQGGSL